MARKFNAKRAPASQVRARVDSTCRFVIGRSASGNIKNVTLEMAKTAAHKNKLPEADVIAKLRQMGAEI